MGQAANLKCIGPATGRRKFLLLNLPFERPVQRDYGCPHGIKADYYWPPIDLLLFGAAVREDAALYYIDAVTAKMTRHAVIEAVQELTPDAIFTVVSSITLDSDLSMIAELRKCLSHLRIWASGDVVFFGETDLPGIDYHVRDLTNKLEITNYWAHDPGRGIIHESGNAEFSVGICPHELILHYSYAMPYSLHRGITSISTNYGCPFPCTFCNSNKIRFKRRMIDEIIEEMLVIQDLGIKEILIRDFTFNMSDARLICDEIIRNRIRLKWSCWTSAALVDREILRKMKAAGCYLISYGAESGDERVIRETRRPVGPERIKEAVRITKAEGLEVLTSFIAGFPGEDRQKTVSLIFDLDPDYLSLNILAPRPGSVLAGSFIFSETPMNTDSLMSSDDDLIMFRNETEKSFFLRPRRLLRYLALSMKSQYRLSIFIKNALGLLRRWHGIGRQDLAVTNTRRLKF